MPLDLPEYIRAFLEEPHYCVMATINRDGRPQLTTMWYDLTDDYVVLNMTRGLLKERNLRRDPRMAICVEDGMRYVTLEGRAEIVEDRAFQEAEVNRMAIRYIGLRLGPKRWDVIARSDRLGVHLHVERFHAHGFNR
jgi:PPOX class probable F420-dependent enzyme